ncbi:MAG: tandem-95 repeat protein [bacterium]|nr:tandem-95 repeat protein [bacterium]
MRNQHHRRGLAARSVLTLFTAIACAALAHGYQDTLVLFPLDEGSGTVANDASGMGNDGTLVGGAVFEANTGDGSAFAVRFDGLNDRIDIGALDLNGSGMTLAAWFLPESFPGPGSDPRLISKASGVDADDHVFMLSTIAVGSSKRLRVRVRIGGSTTTLVAGTGDVATGTWQHAAATHDGATLSLYLNGQPVGSSPLAGSIDVAPLVPVAVGGQPPGAGSRNFDGLLDDVRILQRALSAAEVAALVGGSGVPTAVDDAYATAENRPQSISAANGVLQNDSDPDLDPLQAVLDTDVMNGVLNLNPDGSFDYTPNLDFVGADSFTYHATDGSLDSNPATVTVFVNEVILGMNPAGDSSPTVGNDTYGLDEDTTLVVSAAAGVLANDVDRNPPDDLTAALVSNPVNGTLTSFGSDGAFTYMPDPNFAGIDTFRYEAIDGGSGRAATALVVLTVAGVNDPPVAVSDAYSTPAGVTLVVDAATGVLANDTDVDMDMDILQAVLTEGTADGSINLNPNGGFQYVPDPGFTGQDSFKYRAIDGAASSAPTNVILSVGGANEPPRIVTGSVAFLKRVIGTGVDDAHAVVAADLDGDGDIDTASADFVDDSVFWFENDGDLDFTPHTVDSNLDGAYPVGDGDIDSDGDTDLLAGGYNADTFAWYENNGAGSFTRRTIDPATNGAHSIVAGDMDDDGDTDLLCTSQDANTVTWYENNGNEDFTRHVIDGSAGAAKRAEFADVDDDGDMDVFSASFGSDRIAWHENNGNESFTRRVIDGSADGAYYVYPADFNGDGAIDAVAAIQLADTVAWYENDGSGNFVKRLIDTQAARVRSVYAADMDGDGDQDALAASVEDDTVHWYENDGAGNFVNRGIDIAADGAYGVSAFDVDHDGDADALATARDAQEVLLYQHNRAHSVALGIGESIVISSQLLLTIDPDDGPAGLTYRLTDTPDFGDLRRSGVLLGTNSTFTQADVNANRLTYAHDGSDSPSDSFAFTVADGGENGVEPAAGTFTLIITDPADVVAILPLDEGAGTNAGDASGMGNDGTLVNGASFEASSGDGSPFAVRFDGSNDYIAMGGLDVNGSGLSLALWFNADVFPGSTMDPRLISKASGEAANDHIFMLSTVRVGSSTRLRGRVRVGGVTTTLIASGGDLVTGVWRHAALTHDGSVLRLYLDGQVVGSTPVPGTVDTDASVPVTIGSQPPGAGVRFFDGLLDDVRILQRALSTGEVADLFNGS